MYEIIDEMCAEALKVPVEEYVKKIESITYTEAEKIIDLIFKDKTEQAKQLFNQIN